MKRRIRKKSSFSKGQKRRIKQKLTLSNSLNEAQFGGEFDWCFYNKCNIC